MSDEKIVLVTGASRGLGFATARVLAERGLHVYAMARTLGGLEELDDCVKADGGKRPTLLPVDITDDGGIERVAQALHERHGRLDALIHCAAHAPALSPVDHVAAKDLEKSWAINAQGVQRLIHALDPVLMKSNAPVAVFMTDPKEDNPFWSCYNVTKGAGVSFARTYAAERVKTALRVIFHQPPPMPTALRARFYPSETKDALTPCAEAAKAVSALV